MSPRRRAGVDAWPSTPAPPGSPRAAAAGPGDGLTGLLDNPDHERAALRHIWLESIFKPKLQCLDAEISRRIGERHHSSGSRCTPPVRRLLAGKGRIIGDPSIPGHRLIELDDDDIADTHLEGATCFRPGERDRTHCDPFSPTSHADADLEDVYLLDDVPCLLDVDRSAGRLGGNELREHVEQDRIALGADSAPAVSLDMCLRVRSWLTVQNALTRTLWNHSFSTPSIANITFSMSHSP